MLLVCKFFIFKKLIWLICFIESHICIFLSLETIASHKWNILAKYILQQQQSLFISPNDQWYFCWKAFDSESSRIVASIDVCSRPLLLISVVLLVSLETTRQRTFPVMSTIFSRLIAFSAVREREDKTVRLVFKGLHTVALETFWTVTAQECRWTGRVSNWHVSGKQLSVIQQVTDNVRYNLLSLTLIIIYVATISILFMTATQQLE